MGRHRWMDGGGAVAGQAQPAEAIAPPRRVGLSSFEEDPRALLQERLRLFYLVLFSISAVLLAVSIGFISTNPSIGYDSATTLAALIHAGVAATFGASWLIMRRRRPIAIDWLCLVDALVAGLIGVLSGVWVALMPLRFRPETGMLLATSQVLFARAALVPSSAARTAGVGAAIMLPVVIAVYFAYTMGATAAWMRPVTGLVGLAAAWAVIIVALSALTSRVIYGLRRQVEKAMQLGQYTVERLIGKGGMGEVYLARHALLRRPTALKVLDSSTTVAEAVSRFEREVQTTSQLTHPNTVAIYDYGRTPDARFYYAMEYLDGLDLETLVDADGPQPPARVVHILEQVCGALAEAHRRGLIHRDIKPANIMLCERGFVPDFVKVLDFGLVHVAQLAGPKLSIEHTVLGTPHYMAPESILGLGEVDARADIYAVGALAYFLVAGSPPFDGDTAMEVMTHHVRDQPEPLSVRSRRTAPAALEALVHACLAKEPADRPATMGELRAALTALPIERWSEAAAATWWRERAGAVAGRGQGAPAERSPATVAVDLGRRQGAASALEPTQLQHTGVR